jgi:hypothetical protein
MMHPKIHRLACLLVVSLFLIHVAHSQSSYEYIGPVETLDNGIVSLDVSLKTGRIVSFRKQGQKDWLAVCDEPPIPSWHWNPWGGDRIWPTAQFMFNDIYGNSGADPVIDGAPWTLVSKTATAIDYVSGTSPQLGLQIHRRVELLPGRAEALQVCTVKRVGESKIPVHLWTITSVHYGDCILMESDPADRYPGQMPFKWWPEFSSVQPRALPLDGVNAIFVPSPDKPLKIGTYGRWIAQVRGSQAFLQTIVYNPREHYLEESSLQAYLNPVTHTYEIETLSPAWSLEKGDVRQWQVHWKLVDFSPEAKTEIQKALLLREP